MYLMLSGISGGNACHIGQPDAKTHDIAHQPFCARPLEEGAIEQLEIGATCTAGGAYYIEDADIESFGLNYEAYDNAFDQTFAAYAISPTGRSRNT